MPWIDPVSVRTRVYNSGGATRKNQTRTSGKVRQPWRRTAVGVRQDGHTISEWTSASQDRSGLET